MDFAVELDRTDHESVHELLSRVPGWHSPPGRQYQTAEATPYAKDYAFLDGCARAFFIKMQPGTCVHRHRDPAKVTEHFDTDHIVVTTNDRSFICWEDEGQDKAVHLEQGKRYRITDRSVMHWAENRGDTDRIHLLIEYPK